MPNWGGRWWQNNIPNAYTHKGAWTHIFILKYILVCFWNSSRLISQNLSEPTHVADRPNQASHIPTILCQLHEKLFILIWFCFLINKFLVLKYCHHLSYFTFIFASDVNVIIILWYCLCFLNLFRILISEWHGMLLLG